MDKNYEKFSAIMNSDTLDNITERFTKIEANLEEKRLIDEE